jgi:hypothetical protein
MIEGTNDAELHTFLSKLPWPSTAEIADHGEETGIITVVVILQLIWFFANFIARMVQNLPTSALEVETASFAVFTIITKFFWWSKPLNNSLIVVLDDELVAELDRLTFNRALTCQSDYVSEWKSSSKVTYKIDKDTDKSLQNRGTFQWVVQEQKEHRTLTGLTYRSLRIPVFFTALFAALFTGIHAIAWAFDFPTHPEQAAWRTATVMVPGVFMLETFVSVLIMAALFLCSLGFLCLLPCMCIRSWYYDRPFLSPLYGISDFLYIMTTRPRPIWSLAQDLREVLRYWLRKWGWVFVVQMPVYFAARIILSVLLFSTLRAMPSGVYQKSMWVEEILGMDTTQGG